jgi:hypothetical protein
MNCSRCGRELKHGEVFCLNCGEPTLSAVEPTIREKPSDIVTCLVIGLFVMFGIPALLFGGYLLAIGTGYLPAGANGHGYSLAALFIALIPLSVFLALLLFLIKVGLGHRTE